MNAYAVQILPSTIKYIQSLVFNWKNSAVKLPEKARKTVTTATPKKSWYNDIVSGSYFFTNNPFKTENNAESAADIKAYIIPNPYLLSKLKIMYKPTITNAPKSISIRFIFLLKKIGSINDVKKAPVLIVTKATDTLDTFIALKKVIQCTAMMIPVIKNSKIALLVILKDFFFIKKYTVIKMTAIPILYQTNGIASIEIKAPKIAVNPQMKTIKCNSK